MNEQSIEKTDFHIIGASFAGSILARKLAKYGSVTLIDRFIPGTFNNCGGGLPEQVFNQLDIDIPSNKISKIIIDANNKQLESPFSYTVVNRQEFDRAVWQKALDAGCNFIQARYLFHDPKKKTIMVKSNGEEQILDYQKLILANGFNPARQNGLDGKPQQIPPADQKIHGFAHLEVIDQENPFGHDTLFIKINPDIPIGYFWIFPMPDKKINVGAGWIGNEKLSTELLQKFKSEVGINGQVVQKGGGFVPMLPKLKVQQGDNYFFGDSAGMVFALQGEGLKYIFQLSELFAKKIANNGKLNSAWLTSLPFWKILGSSIGLKTVCLFDHITGKRTYGRALRNAAKLYRFLQLYKH
jgi:flavin-dependent dehydrogenase